MENKTKKLNFLKIIEKIKLILMRVISQPQTHYILIGILLIMIGKMIVNGAVPTDLNFFAEVLILTVAALGLNILLGISGLVSLSTAAFIGVTTNGMNILVNTYKNSFKRFALIFLIKANPRN